MSIYEYPDLWFPGAVEIEAYPDLAKSPYHEWCSPDQDFERKSDKARPKKITSKVLMVVNYGLKKVVGLAVRPLKIAHRRN